MRDEHCAFYIDNGQGRCIADCHYNKEYVTDCIGNTGPSMNRPGHHEIPVTSGFIDGRNVSVDARGYKVPPAKTVKAPPVASDTTVDGVEHQELNGCKYVWKKTPGGIQYKSYIKHGRP